MGLWEDIHQIIGLLADLNQKADIIMSAQDDVTAAVAALNAFFTDLNQVVTDLKAQLAAAGNPVNTSALNAITAQLPGVQSAVDALDASKTPPVAGPSPVPPVA